MKSKKSIRKFERKQLVRRIQFYSNTKPHDGNWREYLFDGPVEYPEIQLMRYLSWIKKFRHDEREIEHEEETGHRSIFWPAEIQIENGKYEWYGHPIALPKSVSVKTIIKCRARAQRKLWANRPHPLDTPNSRTYKGALRAYILHVNGKRCQWCGGKDQLEVDHIHPWRLGGKTTLNNAQVLCKSCNTGKYHLEQKGVEVA